MAMTSDELDALMVEGASFTILDRINSAEGIAARLVDENERLRAIEAAALRTVRSTPATATRRVEWESLRTALGEGPRR